MADTTRVRGRGRPRKTPPGARERKWLATDEEYAHAEQEAAAEGITVPELVRRRVLQGFRRWATTDHTTTEETPTP